MADETMKNIHGVGAGDSLSVSGNNSTEGKGVDKNITYVRITPDKKEAWLYLVEKPSKTPYTLEELLVILKAKGVVKGINEDLLIPMAKKRVYKREIKVATFIKPVVGKDGYYEFFFDTSNNQRTPKVREDGSVDYQSMNSVNSVKAGDKLALYHPAEDGVSGYDVCGGEIPADPIKNLLNVQGRNVCVSSDDPNLYIAEKEGRVEYTDGKISINNLYELKQDVDQLIGRVEFYGDVQIFGNVESGVTIRAGKNLTIEGTVEAANIVAGGDIVLKRGIQGNQKATIVCKGNLYADFIEHTQVKCSGDVLANVIMSSKIEAEGKITLTGKKGKVVGGYIHGTQGIDCKVLGNESEVKTIVHAGPLPEVYSKHHTLIQDEEKYRAEIQSLVEELKEIESRVKLTGSLTESMGNRVAEIKELKPDLEANLQKCQEQLASVIGYIQNASSSKIRIDGEIHRGGIICVGQSKLAIEDNTSYMEYRDIAGMIAGKGTR